MHLTLKIINGNLAVKPSLTVINLVLKEYKELDTWAQLSIPTVDRELRGDIQRWAKRLLLRMKTHLLESRHSSCITGRQIASLAFTRPWARRLELIPLLIKETVCLCSLKVTRITKLPRTSQASFVRVVWLQDLRKLQLLTLIVNLSYFYRNT